MNKLTGTILTLPKMSGNVGAKTINIGGKGDDGATFTPSVSADGIISWTNDKDLPNPEPVNIKGTKGDKGDKGDRGLQGVQGIQGERGEQGQKGDKGDRGEQGVQGVQGAKGETGKDGTDGKDGYTPVKGVDYWTEEERNEIVEEVLSQTGDVCIGDTLGIVEQSGGYWSVEGNWASDSSLFSKHTELVEVVEGDNFRYTGCGMYAAASVLWYDKDKNLIGYEQYGADMNSETVTVTAPANSAYARFCSFNYGADTVELEVVVQLSERSIPEGFGGGVYSWNDLTDKPFYEEGSGATIEWDGNTEGRDNFMLNGSVPFYKISDLVPSTSEVVGGVVKTTLTEFTITEDLITHLDGGYFIEESAVVISSTTLIVGETVHEVPTPGIYSGLFEGFYVSSLSYGSTTIKTLDEKFIPDSIARASDVGVKSWNDLEDKPFGETTSLTELHSETLTFDTELANFYRADCIDFNYVFEAGKTYTVIWDGISHSCTAYTHTPSGYVVIGDYGFANGTGEPFYAFYNDIVSSVRFVVQETGTHTIVVCGEEAVTKTLDEKFIPDTIARVDDVTTMINEALGAIENGYY